MPAAYLFYCVSGMLWFIDGWNWSDVFSNMSTRSTIVAAGTLLCMFLSCWDEATHVKCLLRVDAELLLDHKVV